MSAPGAEPRGEGAGGDERRPGDGGAGAAPAGGERRPDEGRPERGGATAPDAMTRGYARSRARTEAIQAQLEPLGPGERPLGLRLAVGLALVIAGANLIGALAGAGSEAPALGIVFALFMVAMAAGMWARKYLILLLFQALLAITIIISALSLAFARSFAQAAVAIALIVLSAPVFWLLIRVMARLQVPRG